mmetsp:Transcript_97116/g.231096  ORF Transcript_97116/g.231096 Transcript_97116/m.231096 type:complete len:315 (-) Transcript_97116:19-963(-)
MGLIIQDALKVQAPEEEVAVLLVPQDGCGGQHQPGAPVLHLLHEALAQLVALLLALRVVPQHPEVGAPKGTLPLPVLDDRSRDHHQTRAQPKVLGQGLQQVQEDQTLGRLAQSHLIRQDPPKATLGQGQQPPDTHLLVALQLPIPWRDGLQTLLALILVVLPLGDAAPADGVLHLVPPLLLGARERLHHRLLHPLRTCLQGLGLLHRLPGPRRRLLPRAASFASGGVGTFGPRLCQQRNGRLQVSAHGPQRRPRRLFREAHGQKQPQGLRRRLLPRQELRGPREVARAPQRPGGRAGREAHVHQHPLQPLRVRI